MILPLDASLYFICRFNQYTYIIHGPCIYNRKHWMGGLILLILY